MRFSILRTLFVKECHRHVANRGGIALGLLLVASAVLLAVVNPTGGGGPSEAGTGMVGGVHHCFIEFDKLTPLVAHLKANVPPELKQQIVFRNWSEVGPQSNVNYSPGIGGIRISETVTAGGRIQNRFQIWHPQGEPAALTPYESWLYRECWKAYHDDAERKLTRLGATTTLPMPNFSKDDLWAVRSSFEQLERDAETARRLSPSTPPEQLVPSVSIERQGLGGKLLDIRSAIATGMVVFALYFTCVYLLPTLNCEERERGVLLAQALSPASPAEILAAKFLFYPLVGGILAAVIAGIYKPPVLSTLFFWLSLGAVAAGFLGIGMTIATLAKTQRAAFMGAMCYLMSVSLVLIICSTNGIPFIPYLAMEYHVPRVLHASLSGDVKSEHWLNLMAAFGLAAIWLTLAGNLFRRRGWQ